MELSLNRHLKASRGIPISLQVFKIEDGEEAQIYHRPGRDSRLGYLFNFNSNPYDKNTQWTGYSFLKRAKQSVQLPPHSLIQLNHQPTKHPYRID